VYNAFLAALQFYRMCNQGRFCSVGISLLKVRSDISNCWWHCFFNWQGCMQCKCRCGLVFKNRNL